MTWKKTGLIAGTALALSLVGFAQAGSATTLKVQTSFTAGQFAYKLMTESWAPKLKAMTGGAVEIDLLPTRAVVPHRETPDAVALGVLDGDLTAISYFTGRDAGFGVMGDLIAGYDNPDQQQSFFRYGGGNAILQELFDKIVPGKIHVIGGTPYAREALVAAVPIRGVADMKGKKIRAPEGLASDVFRRAGATPVSIPLSEVYTALEKGIVDAADSSAYVNNDATGFHKIAKYPLYPGIHSQACLQFTMNKSKWDGLTADQRTALEVWFYAALDDVRRQSDLLDRDLVARDLAEGKVTVIDWPQEDRNKFREIATESWKAFAEKSPLAKKALDAHLAFMKRIGLLK